ncbi:Wound-induced protein 1 [Acorus calamus]|uniref:Wound-induced protein 1 n=1 Tax=Acorus calamus TaxID=4465 RepID=A0AAV9EJ81_ACOCL|nr:Wound-induced protein 1 [Acorus calamus]
MNLKLADPTKSTLNDQQQQEEEEEHKKSLVRALYDALNARDVSVVHRLLAPDIEWWFHGPPDLQFMMRLLTGSVSSFNEPFFPFLPIKIVAFGPTVLAEGSHSLPKAVDEGSDDDARHVSWVHAWTVGDDGIIVQVREYFNTSVTVTRVAAATTSSSSLHCLSQPLRESTVSEESVPGLVLAI